MAKFQTRSATTGVTVKSGAVYRLEQRPPWTDRPLIKALEVAQAAGATPIRLEVVSATGREFNLLGPGDAETLEGHYRSRLQAGDPFASNVFFQPGAAGPLIGLANRLTGQEVRPGVLQARVLGILVSAPINHGLKPGQRPHHLHGVGFDKQTEVVIHSDFEGLHLRAFFEPGFHGPYWTGHFSAQIHHRLHDGNYEFHLQIKNEGTVEIPMGAGSHPYFWALSQDSGSVALRIPGRRLVEIDNYENVLPTGRLQEISPESEFDFRARGGRALDEKYLDNMWVDLEPDPDGFAFVEFFDRSMQLGFRMTATTKNIKGAQVFAPKPGAGASRQVFAALELVTNLPDPREELWGNTPTGMTRLSPGETLEYGYRIEPFRSPGR